MLYLIGLGLWDENDVSLRALENMKECSSVFCEFYTNNWKGNLKFLEKFIGKKIQVIGRHMVESEFIINEAKTKKVALLVSGDPLSATTHFQLWLDCRKQKIPVKVIHSSSIYTSIAETGLQLYKFGRATTLVSSFRAESPLDVISMNRKNGLHSLVLLDIDMTVKEALNMLKKCADSAVVCSCIGSENQKIRYDLISKLLFESFDAPAAIVVPGNLNFKEEEALGMFA